MNRLALIALPLLLTGCVTYHSASDGIARAKLLETVTIGGRRLIATKVLEDSRCPVGVQCVWAGRVRLSVRIDFGTPVEIRELVLGEPQELASGGTLTLVEVEPAKRKDLPVYPEDYRFGFKFVGGL